MNALEKKCFVECNLYESPTTSPTKLIKRNTKYGLLLMIFLVLKLPVFLLVLMIRMICFPFCKIYQVTDKVLEKI